MWNSFSRLADGLTERGDTAKAVEVLDYALEQVPPVQLDHDIWLLSVINSYYAAGAVEKGDKLLDDYLNVAMEYIDYFTRFPRSMDALIERKVSENAMVISELYDLAARYGRHELTGKIDRYFQGEV